VFVMGWVSNIEVFWEEPTLARFLTRLASFSRLIPKKTSLTDDEKHNPIVSGGRVNRCVLAHACRMCRC
jgi:hypothetical protein